MVVSLADHHDWLTKEILGFCESITILFMTAPVWKNVYFLDLLVNKYVHLYMKILGTKQMKIIFKIDIF